jgi:hypothetical protein
MVLKAGGDAERARALYRSAQTSPTYDSWPFASLLEERIATAEARRAQYADPNPLNDPPVWALDGHICRGCHQQR